MRKKGSEPRVHGNTGKRPPNAFPTELLKNAVQFLMNYASDLGLPQPAAPRGRGDKPPTYLPSSNTKYFIHKDYVRVCRETQTRYVGLSTSKELWQRCVPHIKISSPVEDVCRTCEDFRVEIRLARTESDKLTATGCDGQCVYGPDSVISMLDHGFGKFGIGENDCGIHADNCFGFGNIKKLYRRTDCDTPLHIADVVEKSSRSNIPVTYGNNGWVWRSWKDFLLDRYKKVPTISKYHHFRFTADEPGVVFMKVRADDKDEVRFVLCKTNILAMSSEELPAIISPEGMSAQRQKYLYRNVKPLVRRPFQDISCPVPTVSD